MIYNNLILDASYWAHKRFYGERHLERLVDQTIEEAAELIQALAKYKREVMHEHRNTISTSRIVEEAADLTLCVNHFLRAVNYEAPAFETLVEDLGAKLSARLQR